MTFFESVGVERQNDAYNEVDAREMFQHSCQCCLYRGMRIDCNRCAIAQAYEQNVAFFTDRAKEMKKAINK